MKLQIIKIFSFWALVSFLANTVIDNLQTPPAEVSNIQLTKPSVVKVKAPKQLHIGHYTSAKGKRVAMK